jgi:hypothetical protein
VLEFEVDEEFFSVELHEIVPRPIAAAKVPKTSDFARFMIVE